MASPACISGLMDHQNLLEGRVNQVGIKLQTRPRHWVRRLEECARTPWQLYQGANPRERREKARPASQTSPESHPSFPGWATNPFPGSRPCMTLAAAPVPPLQPPPPPPWCLTALPSSHAGPPSSTQTGPKHLLTPGPWHQLLLRKPRCFLPYPLGCPLSDHTSHPSGLFLDLREGCLPSEVAFLCLSSTLSLDL